MLFAILAVAATVQTASDPLAPARSGRVECFDFDLTRKTCRAIGAYRWDAHGEIINDATILVRAMPVVIFQTRSTVYLRDGVECGRVPSMRDQLISVTVDGTVVDDDNLAAMKDRSTAVLDEANHAGAEFCGRYEPQPDGSFVQRVTLDGVARPELDDGFLWVDPAEGWRVAP